MRLLILSMSLLVACQESPKRGPPPDPSITDTGSDDASSSSSTSAMHDAPCAAFSGCMDACTGNDCPSRCASATDSDEQFCMEQRCSDLSAACADGDTKACTDVLACAATEETSTDDGSSSTSTT